MFGHWYTSPSQLVFCICHTFVTVCGKSVRGKQKFGPLLENNVFKKWKKPNVVNRTCSPVYIFKTEHHVWKENDDFSLRK